MEKSPVLHEKDNIKGWLAENLQKTLGKKIERNDSSLLGTIQSKMEIRFNQDMNDLEEHPFTDELSLLQSFQALSVEKASMKIIDTLLLDDLNLKYGSTSFFAPFYYRKLQLYQKYDPLNLGSFVSVILNRWKGMLQQKIEWWKVKRLTEWRSQVLQELLDKMNDINKLKKYFKGDPGRLWDLADGNWTHTEFEVLSQYQELLKNDRAIRRLVELLGKSEVDDKSRFEKVKSKEMSKGREEIVSIREGDDINFLVPSELSLLTDGALETLFYMKLTTKKLLNYDLRVSQPTREIRKTVLPLDKKGPIVVCVDTSGSMHGTPEQIAKTIVYALTEMALEQKRPCYIISFSTSIRTFEVTEYCQIHELLDFLTYSFRGGTSFEGPMREAKQVIRDHKKFNTADVLVISDFVLGSLDNYTQNTISKLRGQDVRLHSLLISTASERKILKHFSHNWVYDIEKQMIVDFSE